MATYTKIGRIRPDYADVWDSARNYTALEVVKSADSYQAYIAKQDVPAGTPLTDEAYWGVVLDVSDVIAESVAATNRANTAAANADAAREGIQDDLNGMRDELHAKGDAIVCTAEGETITLTDSSDDPMRGLRIFGKTEQTSTKGINILDTANTGTFLRNGGVEEHGVIVPITKDGVYRYYIYDSVTVYIGHSDSLEVSATHDVSYVVGASAVSGTLDLRAGQYFLLWFDEDNAVKDSTYYFLALGADSAYEPYTGGKPSPSPDWPQPLVSVGEKGSIEVTATGKNLCNHSEIKEVDLSSGVEVSPDESYTSGYIAVKPNTAYIRSSNCISGSREIAMFDANKGYIDRVFGDAFETTADCRFVRLEWERTVALEKAWFQLEEGSVVTSYEPYKPVQSLTALTPNGLPGIPVSSGGNYTDKNGQMWVCDEIDLGRSVYVKRVGRVDLGTLDWSYYDIYTYFTCITIPSDMSFRDYNYYTPSGIMCTNYPTYGWDKITSSFNNFIAIQETYFSIKTNDYSDVATFKAAMDGVMLYYELTTPTETPLTAEEIAAYRALHTNKPNTTVFNDAGAHMAMEYNADAKTYIDNTAEQADAAREAIKGDFKELSERTDQLSEEIVEVSEKVDDITIVLNLLSKPVKRVTGSFVRYKDHGASNAIHIDNGDTPMVFYKVEPNTEYFFNVISSGLGGCCFFESLDITSGLGYFTNYGAPNWNANIVSPTNANYIVLVEDDRYTNTRFFGTPENYELYIKFGKPVILANDKDVYDLKHSIVTVGVAGDFATVKEGFEYAVAHDLPVLIEPGVYDLVAEGISGKGYIAPKEIYGYGAVLKCDLPSENWLLSPINIDAHSKGSKIYGLTVICSNCRYCIHDDMGISGSYGDFYHNVYKDLTLIHKSEKTSTLIAPQCIGGGYGDYGYIEIDNCVFSCEYFADVSYHSKSVVPQTAQTNDCALKCTSSVFSHAFTQGSIGEDSSYMNTAYVSNCVFGSTLPNTTPQVNSRIIAWNNETSNN